MAARRGQLAPCSRLHHLGSCGRCSLAAAPHSTAQSTSARHAQLLRGRPRCRTQHARAGTQHARAGTHLLRIVVVVTRANGAHALGAHGPCEVHLQAAGRGGAGAGQDGAGAVRVVMGGGGGPTREASVRVWPGSCRQQFRAFQFLISSTHLRQLLADLAVLGLGAPLGVCSNGRCVGLGAPAW